MKFTKMQGLGNDYIYVNCFREDIKHPCELAKRLSDRHFGIGSDGLILIKPSRTADLKMEMYNADGSAGNMCGNGIRCVAKYAYENGLTEKTKLSVETASGIKKLELTLEDGKVKLVCVDMGAPILNPDKIPVIAKTQDPIIGRSILAGDREYAMTCVSMGNPHCVVLVEDVDNFPLEQIGPLFERHSLFPERINTEFVRVIDEKTLQMRVWERGSGETLACGTGACAAAVAGVLNGWTNETVTVKLAGGDLLISWDKEKNTVYMTGPAETVYEGEINI